MINMKTRKDQSGVVLLTSLLIITTLTILVIAASRSTVLQQKMATNMRDRDMAFQSAETALKAGERYLQNTDPLPVFDSSNGRRTFNNSQSFEQDADWSAMSFTQYTQSLFQVASPNYVIEEITLVDTVGESLDSSKPVTSNYYRVTSRSKNRNATVIVQSIYRR